MNSVPNSTLPWVRILAHHIRAKSKEQMMEDVHHINGLETYCHSPTRDKVARLAPTFVAPFELLPPGHAMSGHDNDGTPILVWRNNDNSNIKAYVNRCRHRGSPLIQTNRQQPIAFGSSFALTCPYHAWTYDVRTGALKGVPSESVAFPCLDKAKHGLKELPCFETAGGIWVDGAQFIRKGFWSVEKVHDEVSPLVLSTAATTSTKNTPKKKKPSKLVGYKEWAIQANWQLLVETFWNPIMFKLYARIHLEQ